jgi:anti-sigma regulatory factor (Ser/Thr protein kinase)
MKYSANAATANLAAARAFVEQAARALGAPETAVCEIVLAADEALTNIILHGYRGEGGPVEIEVSPRQGGLLIWLRDRAPVFDPRAVPAADINRPLETRPPGGLGVHFMRQSVDEIVHRSRPDGGNELMLVKNITL